MPGDVKKRKSWELENPMLTEESKKVCTRKPKLKPNSELKSLGSGCKKGNAIRKKGTVKDAISQKKKPFKDQSNSSSQKDTAGEEMKVKKRRRRKRRKDNAVLDEPSRLQRRTRYLLLKVKQEQNLIDAYSAEGWKGQSREKIRPDKELQRARKQILNCKLGIREAVQQLDLLSSVGCIEDSVVAPDGSVHHEHIICAKCKLRDAFPDNDIILCDGTCNRAFHQKCLDPPLSTENIPPGDEGWFCRYCKSKMEILESTNAHLGTNFAPDSNWQDIFKEEAELNDGGESLLCQELDWPSDDSEDVDYNPERRQSSCTNSGTGSESDSSVDGGSCGSLRSLQDDLLFLTGELNKKEKGSEDYVRIESDGTTDCEIMCGPRLRNPVDYIALNDELFGKNALISEQVSEDEDWGPSKRIHRRKESVGEGTNMTVNDDEGKCTEEKSTKAKTKVSASKSNTKTLVENKSHDAEERDNEGRCTEEKPTVAKKKVLASRSNTSPLFENKSHGAEERSAGVKKKLSTGRSRRPIFRFPRNAVEKLRLVFAENELPSRTIREDLAKQLGLDRGKVNKWFKNARYLALKARKKAKRHHASGPGESDESGSVSVEDDSANAMASQDDTVSRGLKSSSQRNNARLVASAFNKKRRKAGLPLLPTRDETAADFGDDVSLKILREKAKKKRKLEIRKTAMQEAELEMERLCRIKDKIEKLKNILLRLPTRRFNKTNAAVLKELAVVYVPVAELRERG